jgi:hypothetical protein
LAESPGLKFADLGSASFWVLNIRDPRQLSRSFVGARVRQPEGTALARDAVLFACLTKLRKGDLKRLQEVGNTLARRKAITIIDSALQIFLKILNVK